MRTWMDWEFLEDGKTIEAISVGMVREDGAKLYYEFADAPWDRIKNEPWLMANVVPHLSGNKTSRWEIRNAVTKFLSEGAKGTPLELWGWYSSYDHVCLAQLFGRMIDLPEWCPMLTKDLKQEFERAGCDGSPYIPRQSTAKHNALEDALHLKVKHEWFDRVGWSKHIRGIQIGNDNTQINSF